MNKLNWIENNTANTQLAWHLLHDNFPSLVCFVCTAHAFSLYAKDIVKNIVKIPEIKEVVSNANAVLKCYSKFKHLQQAILDENCIKIFEQALAVILYVEMHCSVFYSMTRLQHLCMPIKQTVTDPQLRSDINKVPDNIR